VDLPRVEDGAPAHSEDVPEPPGLILSLDPFGAHRVLQNLRFEEGIDPLGRELLVGGLSAISEDTAECPGIVQASHRVGG
jgi:hypothetical protein